MKIEECEGYQHLLKAVLKDQECSPNFHDYQGKLSWAVERARHYAEKTGLEASDILNAWEKKRDYWYMNYYQDANMPRINGESCRVFESQEDYKASIGILGFRCPSCKGISKDPFRCDTGLFMGKKKICDWSAGGIFGTLGKGVYVFLKSEMTGANIFKPVAWEGK